MKLPELIDSVRKPAAVVAATFMMVEAVAAPDSTVAQTHDNRKTPSALVAHRAHEGDNNTLDAVLIAGASLLGVTVLLGAGTGPHIPHARRHLR